MTYDGVKNKRLKIDLIDDDIVIFYIRAVWDGF